MSKKVKFIVFKYDPLSEEKPHYVSYMQEVDRREMVLDVLERIRKNIDPTLAYRHSCHHGVCGSCVALVNGVEKLLCKTRVFNVIGRSNKVVIEPMRNFKVIRDLVVDLEPFFTKLRIITPALIQSQVSQDRETPQSPQNVEAMKQYEECIECGACYSACPIVASDPLYLGPAALMVAYRTCLDERDEGKMERLRLVDSEEGCWRCHNNMGCTEVCPKNVDPASAISGLRRMILSRRLVLWRGRFG